MKKILSTIIALFFVFNITQAEEKIDIDKQLVGIVGAVSGTAKTNTRELKAGDKIYLNETIYAGIDSGTQILLLDQSTFTIGSDSEVVMDTFIYDPTTNDGKIVANVKKGSLKIISGLISKKNPDSLTVKVPEGTLGSRGTEFQTMVSKKNLYDADEIFITNSGIEILPVVAVNDRIINKGKPGPITKFLHMLFLKSFED